MDLLRLSHFAGPVDQCAREPTLAAGALAVGNEQRMLGELGAPRDDRGKQRRVQWFLRARVRSRPMRGRAQRELETCAELRRVEERETSMADLEKDLDEVERES